MNDLSSLSRRSFLLTGAALSAPLLHAQQQTDFLTELSSYQDIKGKLPDYLRALAHEKLAERKRVIASLKTPEDVAKRKALVRSTIEAAIGGFPEKTPLNPKVVGTIQKDGYKIEKIIFESQPGFFVTASLYVPTRGDGPFPGVLYPLGHELGGKSHDAWQRMLVTLARNGYVAITWDPAGQGERAQIYDPDFNQRTLIRSTTEHTVLGVECLLAGDNFARYTIWDGIRALDYLLSRPEVDTSRIACTGNSGGGTHTSYISALEDRIHVAAPSCYLTGWGKLIETIGPQDAEQVLLPWIAAGLDHGDFPLAFAPRPFLMLTAIRDFFSIVGAREVFAEAKQVYGIFGAEDKIDKAEVDRGHGYHQPNRIRAYEWFAKWLKKELYKDGEPDVEVLEFEDLACTPTGRVASSIGGETVFTLNKKRVDSFDPKLPKVTSSGDLGAFQKQVRERAARRSGFDQEKRTVSSESYGDITRQGYRIEKLLLRSRPEIPVPALFFSPHTRSRKPAVVYVHGRGKSAEAAPGGEIEWFVRQGLAVLALDPRGMGETDRVDDRNGSDFPRYFGDYESAMTSFLLAKSLVGMRASDILAGVDWLSERGEVLPNRIAIVGKGKAAVPALYAAAFDERIAAAAFEDMLASYRTVTDNRINRDVLENVVIGALREYDLPDLAAVIAPRPVRLINPVDQLGMRLWPEKAAQAYERAASVHATAGGKLQVLRRKTEAGPETVYADLI
ncbi:MAG: acetylxylan esterase [Acidobacteria bacterium]|nr:acetylxylan esterase [Acidobacteriota bacterium]